MSAPPSVTPEPRFARFLHWRCALDDPALELDFSLSGLEDQDLEAMRPKLDAALEAMAALEGGAHANADEDRIAQRYGVRDSRNPAQNVYAGVLHLRKLIQQFDDVTLALAAYNAGENAVINYGYEVPPYPETQNYVRKVLTFYRHYSNRNRAS